MKIVILASDTAHRRYFIKKIIATGAPVSLIIFETESIKPSFPIGPFYFEEESSFEANNFFLEFNDNLDEYPIKYVKNINNLQSQTLISNECPDLCLSFGTRKISNKTLSLFKDGGINVHRGIAEKYKGLDSNQWALYHKDIENIGVTLHLLDNNLDTGDIIFQETLRYPLDTKIFQMRYYETILATKLSEKALKSYLSGDLKVRKQKNFARYYSFMPLVLKEQLPFNIHNETKSNS